jgi:hypothetical protein
MSPKPKIQVICRLNPKIQVICRLNQHTAIISVESRRTLVCCPPTHLIRCQGGQYANYTKQYVHNSTTVNAR